MSEWCARSSRRQHRHHHLRIPVKGQRVTVAEASGRHTTRQTQQHTGFGGCGRARVIVRRVGCHLTSSISASEQQNDTDVMGGYVHTRDLQVFSSTVLAIAARQTGPGTRDGQVRRLLSRKGRRRSLGLTVPSHRADTFSAKRRHAWSVRCHILHECVILRSTVREETETGRGSGANLTLPFLVSPQWAIPSLMDATGTRKTRREGSARR